MSDALIKKDGIYLHVRVVNDLFNDAIKALNENKTAKNVHAKRLIQALQADLNAKVATIRPTRKRWF